LVDGEESFGDAPSLSRSSLLHLSLGILSFQMPLRDFVPLFARQNVVLDVLL
jgi:hypothetical protein